MTFPHPCIAVAVCASAVHGNRSVMTSLPGVPDPDANEGGVVRPLLGARVAEKVSCNAGEAVE